MLALVTFSVVSILATLIFIAAPNGILSIRRPRLMTLYVIFFVLMSISLVTAPLSTDWLSRPGFPTMAIALPLHLAVILTTYAAVYTALFRNANRPKSWNYDDSTMVKLYTSGLIFCSIIMVLQYAILPTNPIAYILSGTIDNDVAVMMREEAFKLNKGPHIYLLHLNRMVFFPALVGLSVACRLQSGKRHWNWLIAVAVVAAVINGAASTATGVIVIIVIVAGFAYLKAGGRLNASVVTAGVASLFAAPVFFDAIFGGGLSLGIVQNAVLKAAGRASSGPFDALLFYFDNFNDTHNYLGGRTNRIFATLTGQEYFDIQNYIFHQRVGQILARTLHGSFNANFIGYWHADFGLLGVAGISAAVGAAVAAMERGFAYIGDNPAKTACYAACAMVLAKLMSAQPTAVLAGHGAIPALLLAAGLFVWLQARASGRRVAPSAIMLSYRRRQQRRRY